MSIDPKHTQEYLAAENIFFDSRTDLWASDREAESLPYSMGYGPKAGVCGVTLRPARTIHLYYLDDIDRGLVADIPLKDGEFIFRYVTVTTAAGGLMPLIKINVLKGLAYFPVDLDSEQVQFETRGEKLDHLRLRLEDVTKYGVV